MPTVSITWHAMADACPICKDLNGYTWVFQVGKDVMTDALFHPQYGIVWSLEQGSNAHAHGYLSGQTNNCRCHIEPHIECEDVLAKCVYLREAIMDMASETSDTKSGSYQTTTFEDIGATPPDE
jgi:hypothetical protein